MWLTSVMPMPEGRKKKGHLVRSKKVKQRPKTWAEMEPEDWQARNVAGATEGVHVRCLPGQQSQTPKGGSKRHTATRVQCRSRILTGHFFRRLSDEQLWAAEQIYGGYSVYAYNLGVKSSSLRPKESDGGQNRPESRFDVQQDQRDRYFRWHRWCDANKIDASLVMVVIGYGLSCLECDRKFRQRDGTTSKECKAALDLYLAVFRGKFDVDNPPMPPEGDAPLRKA